MDRTTGKWAVYGNSVATCLEKGLGYIGMGVLVPATKCACRSLVSMRSMFLAMLLWFLVLAVIGLQMFMVVMEYKCAPENNQTSSDEEYSYCGTSPGAKRCPSGQSCVGSLNNLPEWGFSHFNNFGWAYLTTIRLAVLDFWEYPYTILLHTKGYWSLWYFVIITTSCTCFVAGPLAIITKKFASQQKHLLKPVEDKTLPWNAETELNAASASPGPKGGCGRCTDLFCMWECCGCWRTFTGGLAKGLFSPYFEVFISVTLMINTILMSMDHDLMDWKIARIAINFEFAMVLIFIVEALLKILALSPKGYFTNGWNTFEFCVAVLGFVELTLMGVAGLSVLAAFRVLRIVRLGRYWPTFNFQVQSLARSQKTILQFSILYFLVFVLVACIGTEVFAMAYVENASRLPGGRIPRWNYTDMTHSFLNIFRILCGEWVETMYDLFLVAGMGSPLVFYICVVVLGKYLLVNVFLVFLISSLHTSSVEYPSGQESVKRLSSVMDFVVDGYRNIMTKVWKSKQEGGYLREGNDNVTLSIDEVHSGTDTEPVITAARGYPSRSAPSPPSSPPDCFSGSSLSSCFSSGHPSPSSWTTARTLCFKIVSSWVFEAVIFVVIVLGCVPLTIHHLESVREAVGIHKFWTVIKIAVPVLFAIEMVLKLVGYGWAYFFRSGWRTVDFVIVVIVLVNMLTFSAPTNLTFRFLQSLQALRLFRVQYYLLRFDAFRVVVNMFLGSVPSVINVMMIISVIWLLYAIMGVQMFAGLFYRCVNEDGEPFHYSEVPHKDACLEANSSSWVNHPMNFDNLIQSAISLFQVGTFKGWISIMHNAIDASSWGDQPIKALNLHRSWYFFFFIVQVTLYTYAHVLSSLLASLVQEERLEGDGETEGNSIYRRVLQYIGNKNISIPEAPTTPMRSFLHHLTQRWVFHLVVSLCIISGILALACDSAHQSQEKSYGLESFHIVLVVALAWEVLIRVLAYSSPVSFVSCPVNVVDALVLILAIVDLSSSYLVSSYFVCPLVLRVPRLIQIFWSFSFSSRFLGLRRVRLTIRKALPHFLSVYAIMFIFIIVFCIIGVNLFHSASALKDHQYFFNFEYFGDTMILMFQIATTAGWDGYFEALTNVDNCTFHDESKFSTCGHELFVPSFLVIYIAFCLLALCAIPVLLVKFYKDSCDEIRLGVSPDDLDQFYKHWLQYDVTGQGFMPYKDLSSFLDCLSGSLRLPKPNSCEVALLDIPIYAGQFVHHREVLEQLARRRITKWGYRIVEEAVVDKDWEGPSLQAISSSLWRAHEEKSVRIIEKSWMAYKNRARRG